MNSSISRATIRNKSKKQKILVLAIASLLISGTAVSAAQTFVLGGWNNVYADRFNPSISQSTGHDNAKINKWHSSWVKVGSRRGDSGNASANQISYAKVVGAWNGNLSGWYQAW
ncbi:hypothetical protein [Lactococcus fujiensis]|uniref:Lactococcin 972 family bacteriocin n=1 Tax=Lactococcus fujiensis JCM 16395 TaxID=1291764 RepID=A0A2A5RID3_9LACT|nr:hypothetical protein [Lactococcus fujiensis]PCR98845.1 hypothetical protein RT41_GL000876 [Lactococcus fujiensis JCM 16395]